VGAAGSAPASTPTNPKLKLARRIGLISAAWDIPGRIDLHISLVSECRSTPATSVAKWLHIDATVRITDRNGRRVVTITPKAMKNATKVSEKTLRWKWTTEDPSKNN
jgi:hypothetical protein